MKAASRFQIVLAVLVALFVLGVALAVGGLLAWHDPGAAVVVAIATLAGVLAAAMAYGVARSVDLGEEEPQAEGLPRQVAPGAARPRIDALPVASLPAPYLAAVMKGLQADRLARSRGDAGPDRQVGC